MGVRSKMEPWSLHDDFSLVNESGSPLSTAISTSFWDQLLQNKVDSNTLFAMTASPADRGLQPSTPTFYSYARDTSQGSDSTGSSSHSDQQEERCKRRRMLQFNPGVNTGGFARDSPSSYERVIGSPTTTYSSYSSYSPSYESSPLSTVYSGDDYMLPPYDSSPGLTTSAWFPGSDSISSCVLPNPPQQPVDNWTLLQTLEKSRPYCVPAQTKASVLPLDTYNFNILRELYGLQAWKRPLLPMPLSDTSQQHILPPLQHQQPSRQAIQPKQEVGASQNALSPFSKPPTPGRRRSAEPTAPKTKSPKPVALPFTMLKPSAAQGDVTLNDINKILLSPPPSPTDRPFSSHENKRPRSPPGAGLSGKSVVACTKIHTEGAGTITIMRTKG